MLNHTIRNTLAIALFILSPAGIAAEVKQSRSGICHDASSPYYEKTQNYTAFSSLHECLKDGGRLPKGVTLSAALDTPSPAPAPVLNARKRIPKYDRGAFNHWNDTNGDCVNTRHELLMSSSTSTVDTGRNKCTATRGRWLDPYSGKIFYNAIDLDIDHVVPLHFAWMRGAYTWTDAQREAFANDARNLFAVQKELNREKGAMGPLEWLPPNTAFQCEYVTRFMRIAILYKLEFDDHEKRQLDAQRMRLCKS
jgi:hypothetical protein